MRIQLILSTLFAIFPKYLLTCIAAVTASQLLSWRIGTPDLILWTGGWQPEGTPFNGLASRAQEDRTCDSRWCLESPPRIRELWFSRLLRASCWPVSNPQGAEHVQFPEHNETVVCSTKKIQCLWWPWGWDYKSNKARGLGITLLHLDNPNSSPSFRHQAGLTGRVSLSRGPCAALNLLNLKNK